MLECLLSNYNKYFTIIGNSTLNCLILKLLFEKNIFFCNASKQYQRPQSKNQLLPLYGLRYAFFQPFSFKASFEDELLRHDTPAFTESFRESTNHFIFKCLYRKMHSLKGHPEVYSLYLRSTTPKTPRRKNLADSAPLRVCDPE